METVKKKKKGNDLLGKKFVMFKIKSYSFQNNLLVVKIIDKVIDFKNLFRFFHVVKIIIKLNFFGDAFLQNSWSGRGIHNRLPAVPEKRFLLYKISSEPHIKTEKHVRHKQTMARS